MSVTSPSRTDPLLAQRVATAVVGAAVVFAGIFTLPGDGVVAVIALVTGLAAWEWSRLAAVTQWALRLIYAVSIALIASATAWPVGNDVATVVMVIALTWWLGFAGWLAWGGAPRASPTGARWGWLSVGALSLTALGLAFAALAQPNPLGRWLLLYAICLVWVADIGGFFVGRGWGRHKLAPKVSGGKTWEGVLGSLVAAAVYALVGGLLLQVPWSMLPLWCLVTLAAGAISIVGDLCESVIKREAGAKDSGQMLPGHGGLLDRIDSLIAAMPMLALGFMALELLPH